MSAPALPLSHRRPIHAHWRVGVAALALILAGAIAIAVATHESTSTAHSRPARVAPVSATPINGQTLQQARCSDWLAAPAPQKAAAVASLSAIVGAPTEYKGVRGTTLTPQQTYTLLNNACSSPIARHFLLYELYIRAAAFSRLAVGEP